MITHEIPILAGDLIKSYDHATRNDDYMIGEVIEPMTYDGRIRAKLTMVVRAGKPVDLPEDAGEFFTPPPGALLDDREPRMGRDGQPLGEPRIVVLKRPEPQGLAI